MTIPTTIGASKEDASLAQLHAEDAEDPVKVALRRPGPTQLKHKLTILFEKPPNPNSSESFPADLRDAPIFSPTKPAELTSLPQKTWKEFYDEFQKTNTCSPWILLILLALGGLIAILITVDMSTVGILVGVGVWHVLFIWLVIVAVRVRNTTNRVRVELVSDFNERFEKAGYRMTFGNLSARRDCLEIQPLRAEGV